MRGDNDDEGEKDDDNSPRNCLTNFKLKALHM